MITRVGQISALATTTAIPTHQVGDMLVMFAYRAGFAFPAPSLPDGWVQLDSGGSGFNSSTVAYRIATTNSTTSGTWSNASGIICLVYRTTGRWKTPRIAVKGNPIGDSTMTYPDLPARPGNAWFIRFAGNRSATNVNSTTPAGWTTTSGEAIRVRSMDSGGSVATSANEIGDDTQAVNTAVSWRTVTVSIAESVTPTGPLLDVWNKIPASGTVLTLSGLNLNLYDDQPLKFQGIFTQPSYTLKKIKYPASLKPTSISEGVTNLDAALLASTGPVIVLAQSQGAQVCSHWMDQYADDPVRQALASRVRFLLTGNPLRKYNGDAIGATEVGGTIGVATRTDVVWPVVDFARRYDGWPDAPTDQSNGLALKNAKLGKNSFHLSYDKPDLFDDTHVVWTEGNVTYVLTQETPPVFSKMKDWVANVLDWTRYRIEQGYSRVEAPPAQPPAAPNYFWQAMVNKIANQ